MENPRVKIYLEGKCFDLSRDIAEKIPYIANMYEGTNNKEGDITIKRSARLFKYVLEFVIDDTYLFPAQYEQELRFYCIEYKPENLYYEDTKITDKLTQLCAYNERVDQLLRNLFVAQVFPYTCIRCRCKRGLQSRQSVCLNCKPFCVITDCSELTQNQYCDKHKNEHLFCNIKACIWFKLKGSQYCIEHEYHHF